MTDFIQDLFADRIGGNKFGKSTEIYKFEKIKIAKRKALQDFPDRRLLDFGVGEPDKRPSDKLCKELYDWSLKLTKHGYTDTGKDDYRKTVVKYLDKHFNVKGLDYVLNVLPTIGTKEALANFPKTIINPGDIALIPTPGYPILGTNTKYLGGDVYPMPLLAENNFFPDLDKIPKEILEKAKLMYLNYPNNPIGKCATVEFYERVIKFAKDNNLVVVQDAPYISIVYGRDPLSFLSVPGAIDVAIEMHSFSKSFSMTGWRIGFVAGNEQLIKALTFVKNNTDSGNFEAIQKVGIYAMEHPELNNGVNALYERRLKLLVSTLQDLGLDATMPEGTFYTFLPVPKSMTVDGNTTEFTSAEEFTKFMIEQFGIVTVPWDDNDRSFIRFSATIEADDEAAEIEYMRMLRSRLVNVKFNKV